MAASVSRPRSRSASRSTRSYPRAAANRSARRSASTGPRPPSASLAGCRATRRQTVPATTPHRSHRPGRPAPRASRPAPTAGATRPRTRQAHSVSDATRAARGLSRVVEWNRETSFDPEGGLVVWLTLVPDLASGTWPGFSPCRDREPTRPSTQGRPRDRRRGSKSRGREAVCSWRGESLSGTRINPGRRIRHLGRPCGVNRDSCPAGSDRERGR